MRFNPFRKRRKIKRYVPQKTVYKNPFFSKENFSDIFFRKLKVHYGFLVLIVFSLSYLLFFSELFQLNFIEIKGSQETNPREIEDLVKNELEKSRFLFFSQKNYFLFDLNSARKNIRSKIQENVALENFSIKKIFPRTLKVVLKEVNPSFTFLTQKNYYYLDKNGIVAQFIEGGEENRNKNFPLIKDLNNFLVKPQEKILSADLLKKLPAINNKFKNINVEIDHYLIPELSCLSIEEVGAENEKIEIEQENINVNTNININTNQTNNLNHNNNLNTEKPCDLKALMAKTSYLRLMTKDNYQIIIDTAKNIDSQIENFVKVIKTTLKGKLEFLEYIDLRFENWIYYK